MPRQIITVLFLVCAQIIALPAYALEFTQGQWELTVRQSFDGMPTGMGEVQWRECLTQANPIPTGYLQAHNCDVLESHAVYRTLHYRLSCYGEHGTFTNEGKVRFGDFKINGESRSEMGDVGREHMVVRYKFKGRRIGDCP